MKYIKELYEKTYIYNLITSDSSYHTSMNLLSSVNVIILVPKDLIDGMSIPNNFKLLNEDYIINNSDKIVNDIPKSLDDYYIIMIPYLNPDDTEDGEGYLYDNSSKMLVDNDRIMVNDLIKSLIDKEVS